MHNLILYIFKHLFYFMFYSLFFYILISIYFTTLVSVFNLRYKILLKLVDNYTFNNVYK